MKKPVDLSGLSQEQYQITQQCGTEPPFSGAYVDHHENGIYTCVVCGAQLFDSSAKYDSGSGWPSFFASLDNGPLKSRFDDSHGMRREEIRCAQCDAHLGHVFADGPPPSGQRFCVNSGALNFLPAPAVTEFTFSAHLLDQDYRHFISGHRCFPPWPEGFELAVFGMGCFWGAEKKFWQLPGVYTTAVAYAGGQLEQPDYQQVCHTDSGHAEVVLVVFKPEDIRYPQLLEVFWQGHDPTQGMRQGPDVGRQYRSLIMTYSTQQMEQAQRSLKKQQQLVERQITTTIMPATCFNYAEEYHQQYLAKR